MKLNLVFFMFSTKTNLKNYYYAALAKLAIASAFQAEDHGFESRMPLQPFYISSVNGNGCFAARVRGLYAKGTDSNSFFE